MLYNLATSKVKSRRDDILLTVDFNLRTGNASWAPKSRRDDTCIVYTPEHKVPSHAGLRDERSVSVIRRLKPTVNQVSSLRDLPVPSLWGWFGFYECYSQIA